MARLFPGSGTNTFGISNPTSGLDVTGSVMAMAVWFKYTGAGTFASKDNGNTGGRQYRFGLEPGVLFRVETSAGIQPTVLGATTPSTGVWHHAVANMSGGGAGVYLDGVLDGSGGISGTIIDTASDFYIGRRANGSTPTYITGSLAELIIWNGYALSLAQIQALAKGAHWHQIGAPLPTAYYPLWGGAASDNAIDFTGHGNTASNGSGSIAAADHAPVGPYVLL